jgi:hypothetical protein
MHVIRHAPPKCSAYRSVVTKCIRSMLCQCTCHICSTQLQVLGLRVCAASRVEVEQRSLPCRIPSFATFRLECLRTWFIHILVYVFRAATSGLLLWLLLLLLLASTSVRTYLINHNSYIKGEGELFDHMRYP